MKKLLGYTVYLSKQASKVMNTSKIVAKSDKMPVFDATTELWIVHEDIELGDESYTKVYNLSKEAILSIEYDYEKTKEWFIAPKDNTNDEKIKSKPYSWKNVGSSIDVPTPMFASQEAQEEFDKTLVEELNKSLIKEINGNMKIGNIKL